MAFHGAPNPQDQLQHHPNHPHHRHPPHHGLIKVASEPNVRLPTHPMHPHPHPVCQEAKPRLTKEQHDILEAHFQQQNKPSTSTKKGFAEGLGVPLEKINNWFQNRRAKVKQEIKKAEAQRQQLEQQMQQQPQQHQPSQPQPQPQHQQLQMQQPPQAQQPQPLPQQLPMRPMVPIPQQSQPQDFYANANMTSSSLPGNGFAVAPSPEMAMPQISTQDYSSPHGHALQSISESTQPGSYDGIMASLASAGYDVQTSNGLSMPQSLPMDDPFMVPDGPGLSSMGDDQLQFSDFQGSGDLLGGGFGGMPGGEFEFDALASSAPASFARKSLSTSASPCSGPQSLNNANSSATSLQSGWIDDGGATPSNQPAHERSGSIDPTDNQWMQNFGQDMYQQANTSNQTLMSSAPDFNQQLSYADDSANRDSPAGLLSQSMSNVDIQGPGSDMVFKHDQSSSIAARRQRPRPAALGQASLRSASYSGGMPSSPSAANQHLKTNMRVRKTRSTGLFSGGGRIQKPMVGPPQRSPLQFAFNEDVLSGFGHANINGPPMARSASLAPPTPLTPGVPTWSCPPGSAGMHSHEDLSQTEPPSSAFSMAPSTSVFSSASPPETPHSLISLMATRPNFKDTPPQSAPATQQSFPRNLFVPQPTIGEPHMDHHLSFRRPSMPEANMVPPGFEFPMHPGVPIINTSEMDLGHSMQFAQDPSMEKMHLGPDGHHMHGNMQPDLYVHQYSPPDPSGFSGNAPRRRESQPKSYIFANQTPGDFKA
ncbi:uncharacterized protein BKA78DRAFT_351758 [Phyllosticta capitalensis]|uniref:uncharacterized protein n=1 Tax=Phyllosticta capitalensis TaxID=121624 RepID=UPI0031317ACD